MPKLWVYEASQVPRYRIPEDEAGIVTNLVGQRAFLATALSTLSGSLAGSFELRLLANASAQVRLLIAIEMGTAVEDAHQSTAVRVVERVLPSGYSWARASEDALDGDLRGHPLRVARLVRTVEFIDLPPSTSTAITNLVSSSSDNPAGARASQVDASLGYSGAPLRELPPLFTSAESLGSSRLCIPILGSLNTWRAEARVLLEEMMQSRPVAISIHVRPTYPHELSRSMPIATYWRLFLSRFVNDLAASGAGEPRAIIDTLARYSRPATQLHQVTLRCAALNDRDAVAVASILASTLGGARSFIVNPPGRDVGCSELRDLWSEYPEDVILGSETKDNWSKFATDLIRNANIEEPQDEEALDLMVRLPHIYTTEEVESLAQLPISGEEGLPGLVTTMLPPFYSDPPKTLHDNFAVPDGRVPEQRIRVGRHVYQRSLRERGPDADEHKPWHHLPVNDLTKHALIVGSTGSGKTVTTSFLVGELKRVGMPFLVIEPVKTEYFDRLLKRGFRNVDISRYRFEGTADGHVSEQFPPFDPMYLQRNVTVARHASYLKSCFEAAFPLDAASALILESGIRQYYLDEGGAGCGLKIFSRGGPEAVAAGERVVAVERAVLLDDGKSEIRRKYKRVRCIHPSLGGFISYFLYNFLRRVVRVNQQTGGRASELRDTWEQMFERRFDAIATGMIGLAADKANNLYEADPGNYDPFSYLLEGNVVLELDGIPDDDQKALMMAFVSTFLFERRQADDFLIREGNGTPLEQLKHVVVIEEAHRLLSNVSLGGRGEIAGLGAKAKSVSTFVDMLAEMRALGQGIVIVEQIPTKIVPEAIKNTNLKIMLRLTAADDREFLGAAMNLTEEQKRFVTSLRADGDGVSMVVFEQQSDRPRLLQLPFDA